MAGRESQQKWFESIVESIPHMVWVAGPNGDNIYNNKRLEEFTGLRGDALRGQGWMQTFHPDDLAAIAAGWREAAEQGRELSVNRRVRRHDGAYRWCEIRATPFRDERGQIVRWMGTWTDIHDHLIAEQQVKYNEWLYRAIGESIDYGVWVCEPDGRNIYVSESFRKLLGLTQEGCSDYKWSSRLHPDDVERTLSAWKECVRTEGTWDMEQRFRGVDGKWHPILARGVPVRNEQGEVIRWAGICLDISKMKATERRLREADRAKNQFLAVLSHELRNPLAPIRNSITLLRRAGPGSAQAQRAVEVIDRQSSQLARLVEDILDITRINMGKVRLKKKVLSLGDVVQEVMDDQRTLFTKNGITLQFHAEREPLRVEVDAARMSQVVGNLLQNAAKFTPKGGHVTVSLGKRGDRAMLWVTDDGVGMDGTTLARLFQAFSQADSTLNRSQGGLGLGLALVKSLVELHGGEVRAASPGLGKGSELEVSVPLAEPATTVTSIPATIPQGRRSVVIIEDNVDSAATLRDLLELEGHQVFVAYDGRQGLDAVLANAPDVVLCDVGVPSIEGYEIARRLRAEGCRARLVALTGYTAPEDVERAREAGFDEHLPKPSDPDKVLAVVAASPNR